MATKQKAADEAYHRAEAQRALVVVIDAAEFALRGLDHDGEEPTIRAAIATVRAHFLKVSEPPKVKTLAGQIDLVDGSVEGAPAVFEQHGVRVPGVPDTCPECSVDMHSVYGGSWVPVITGHSTGLQCAHCAFIVTVTRSAWEAVREERARTIGQSDRPHERAEKPGRRTRGAE